jgi:hypothetical protein
MLGLLILFTFFIIISLHLAKKKPVEIRKLAGLEAMREAVGRAAELGRPVHWTAGYGMALHGGGLASSSGMSLIAGLSIFTYLARLCAKMNAELIATFCVAELQPMAIQSASEIYASEGKSENFKPENFIFLSSYQFAYVSGVVGILERRKVAANILCGSIAGEALILAEAGVNVGAIQIAGATGQLPFFIVTCDYVLIAEEFLAAAAYVTGDPVQLGSIRGQDYGKIATIALLLVLSILLTFNIDLTWIYKV